ncbi:MAG: hypothetical protein KC457_02030 [Myxococcales bacterium]|nr:hypothetical protein [Myxococcales bacterium]
MGAAALAAGCGDDQAAHGEAVAVIQPESDGAALVLDAAVITDLAAREGVDAEAAREQALDVLRLVAARRDELATRATPPTHPDDLDPQRRAALERATLARLWLDEVFEPSHGADDIPARVLNANMADPRVSRRLFHPDVWFVCQALVMPAGKAADGQPTPVPGAPVDDEVPADLEQAARWYAEAEDAFAPFVARVQRLEPELLGGDCALLGRLVGASERALGDAESPLGVMALRYESFAFAPSTVQGFDPAWLEQVATLDGPGLVGPFPTNFGLHLVLVSKIEPANLADASLPEAELTAAREAQLRHELELSWRGQELMASLEDMRARRVVRMAAGLEQER